MIYREMRRKDREVKELSRIEAVIDRAPYCHLAFFDGQWPYVIPISFGYEPGHLYLHSAKEGKKVDIIAANPRVSFSMEVDTTPVPVPQARSGLKQPYRSVIGYGEISLITNEEEERKIHAMKVLAAHYCRQGVDVPRTTKILERVAVWDLKILHMTGKERGPFIER